MALLGLDIGTTGAKATAFDIEGHVISYAYQEYNLDFTDNRCEFTPEAIFEAVKSVIKRAVSQAAPVHIEAICASSIGEAFILLDKDGCELVNSPIYLDARGGEECALLAEHFGADRIMGITGHPPAAMYSICKLMWFARHEPKLLEKVKYLLFFGNYVMYKLGGRPVTDYSLAARSMCFDIHSKQWSGEIISYAGLDTGIFPETAAAGTVIGNISSGIAQELGINNTAKLVLGGHDQVMAAIGAGVIKPGQAVNGIGTVDCITPLFKGVRINNRMLAASFANVPYAEDDTFVTYAFNFTGGSLLKWFRDTFAAWESKDGDANLYEKLNREAPAEPTNLLVLPYFGGTPVHRMGADLKGTITNLTLATNRGEIYRACMEGEAFEMRYYLEMLKCSDIGIDEMRTVGGGSRSPQWLQIRADIFNKMIVTMQCEEAGTLGAAMLAGVATGHYSSIEDAAEFVPQIKAYYSPGKNCAFYEEKYQKYVSLCERMSGYT